MDEYRSLMGWLECIESELGYMNQIAVNIGHRFVLGVLVEMIILELAVQKLNYQILWLVRMMSEPEIHMRDPVVGKQVLLDKLVVPVLVLFFQTTAN
jgi:hypothetical protein